MRHQQLKPEQLLNQEHRGPLCHLQTAMQFTGRRGAAIAYGAVKLKEFVTRQKDESPNEYSRHKCPSYAGSPASLRARHALLVSI